MDSPVFYVFLAGHLISLIVAMGSVVVIDVFGLLFILKKTDLKFVMRVADTTQKLIWIGWGGLVVTGAVLITLKGYIDNLTAMKLYFVALVAANGIFLHTIKKSIEDLGSPNKLPKHIMFSMGLATVISQVGWWSAIAIGFLHRHWRHHIDWPEHPAAWMIGITIAILALAVFGRVAIKTRA